MNDTICYESPVLRSVYNWKESLILTLLVGNGGGGAWGTGSHILLLLERWNKVLYVLFTIGDWSIKCYIK